MGLNHKRKYSNLRRTDNNEDYLGTPNTSTTTTKLDLSIQHEMDQELDRLNREISDLYQQIKSRKEKIERIKIERAVKKAKKETEERVRRESNKWLPTLDKVTEVQKEIIKNLSDSDSDKDDELDFDHDDDDTISGFIQFVKNNTK